jgi:hypothetical protein
VTVKNAAGHIVSIVTFTEPIELQPPCCTVTFNVTIPDAPAMKVMLRVPAPPVIAPFPIDQVYVAPTPASGTEAPWPPELEQTEEGAVIVESGDVVTMALVIAAVDTQPAIVAVTLYEPDAASVAEAMDGLCWLDVNVFGPLQEYDAPATVEAMSCSVCPTQIGPLLLATGAGVLLTVRVPADEASD